MKFDQFWGISTTDMIKRTPPKQTPHPHSITGLTQSERRKFSSSTRDDGKRLTSRTRPSPGTRSKIRAQRQQDSQSQKRLKHFNQRRRSLPLDFEDDLDLSGCSQPKMPDTQPTPSDDNLGKSFEDLVKQVEREAQEAANNNPAPPVKPATMAEPAMTPADPAFWEGLFSAPKWLRMEERQLRMEESVAKLDQVATDVVTLKSDFKSDIQDINTQVKESESRLKEFVTAKHEEQQKQIDDNQQQVRKLEEDLKLALEQIKALTARMDSGLPEVNMEMIDEAVKKQVNDSLDSAQKVAKEKNDWERPTTSQEFQLENSRYNVCVSGIIDEEDTPAGKEKEKQALLAKLRLLDPNIDYSKDIRIHHRFRDYPNSKKPLPIRVIFKQRCDAERLLDKANHMNNRAFFRDWPKFLRDRSKKLRAEIEQLKAKDSGREFQLLSRGGLIWNYVDKSAQKRKSTGQNTGANSSATPAKKARTDGNQAQTPVPGTSSGQVKMTKAQKTKARRLAQKEKQKEKKRQEAAAKGLTSQPSTSAASKEDNVQVSNAGQPSQGLEQRDHAQQPLAQQPQAQQPQPQTLQVNGQENQAQPQISPEQQQMMMSLLMKTMSTMMAGIPQDQMPMETNQ